MSLFFSENQAIINTAQHYFNSELKQFGDLKYAYMVLNADIIVPHMGLTTGGNIGAETALKLEDCVLLINAWAQAAKTVREDVIVLCHGGPISTPEDAQFIMDNCPQCDGFYGASSMERLPAETALTDTTKQFKSIRR